MQTLESRGVLECGSGVEPNTVVLGGRGTSAERRRMGCC